MNYKSTQKQFVDEQSLLEDAYRLGVQIFASGYRPNFLVGLWRGGSSVGIYVQESLQYLGVETDHISVRTSYQGMEHYQYITENPNEIRIHGLQYLLETMNHQDSLLVVDDVFNTGLSVAALLDSLTLKMKRNVPGDIRIAVPYYKPENNLTNRIPDYYIHETSDWLVLPYELTGLSDQELIENKPWAAKLLGLNG